MRTLLIATPDQATLASLLESAELTVDRVSNLESARALIEQGDRIDAILLRLPCEETTPESALAELQHIAPLIPVIIWAPAARTTEAVRYSQLGAWQFLTDDLDARELQDSVIEAIVQKRFEEAADAASFRATEPWRALLVGESWPMRVICQVIRLVSPRRCSVLVTGETGTGKEVVARAIHMASPRAQYPLVAVNCSALPNELLEAELFGHVKGAFTGAFANRIGRFEQAHKGTLFLDEISEIPLNLQAKLLRVLQEFEFQRLGSSETIKVDVRVIAASNANLLDRVRAGQFREDLYYRLNVAPIQLPPLRNRREDIPLLLNHFIHKISRLEKIAPKTIPADAVERLSEYSWPGNVRQLENMVEMAMAISGDRPTLQLADFPSVLSNNMSNGIFAMPDEGLNYNEVVDEFERSLLSQALRLTNGNKKLAAQRLKLKRTTFAAKLRSLQIALDDLSDSDDDEDETIGGMAVSAMRATA